MKEINNELFASALTNYFFDRNRVIIDTKAVGENYDPYQVMICESYLKKKNKSTYYQRELQTSNHPFLKEVCHLYEHVGSESITVYLGKMTTNHLGCMDDFEKAGIPRIYYDITLQQLADVMGLSGSVNVLL